MIGGPTHELAVGVTERTAFIGDEPKLTAVKLGVFAEPLAASPMVAFEFVQLNVVPATVLENTDDETTPLWHTTTLEGVNILGIGLTVTLPDAVS